MKRLKTIIFIALIIPAIIISQTACGSEEPVSKTSYYLDTICQIDIYGMEEEDANKAIQGAFKLCSEYEKILSKTMEDSDIWNINHAEGKAVKVDERTIEVIEKGIYYGDLSKGKFDITIGKVTDLWDFHADEPKVPDADKIAEALTHVNYKGISIDGNKVTMSDPEAQIDLGGIAKGYICDKVSEYLVSQGVESGVVSLGGNITTIGLKNGKDKWKVGIERPYSDRTEIVGLVEAEDMTVVTSGVYERCFEENGRIYHHILDVNNGYPVDNEVESVSIISALGNSVDCDGLSTICLALGVEEGKALIESIDGVEAVFIDSDDNITCTEGAGFIEN